MNLSVISGGILTHLTIEIHNFETTGKTVWYLAIGGHVTSFLICYYHPDLPSPVEVFPFDRHSGEGRKASN